MNSSWSTKSSGLRLRVHLSDGSVESFFQADKAKAEQIWQSVEPERLFARQRLVIAGMRFKSVFVCSEIVRVDFIEPTRVCWQFPEAFSDVVELSEHDFRKNARLDHPELMPKREQPTLAGDPLVSFLKLRFSGNPPIYLMAEFSVKLPVENHSYMRFLLSKTGFHMRLAGGGVGVVNLAHLAGYTAYPGVAQVPSDSWEAEPVVEATT